MEGVSTEGIPTPDELARIIDGIIHQRLLILIAEDEKYLKLQTQKLVLLNEQRRHHWQSLKKWANFVNSWTWMIILIAFIFFLGLYTGLNVLPRGVSRSSTEI